MTGKEIFKIWSPPETKWTDWVRPVPFISIDTSSQSKSYLDFTFPDILYINNLPTDTALIVDLPGLASIKEGLALSKVGFRPIPIYNGTIEQTGALSTTNNTNIERGLIFGATYLPEINFENNAPPVFLLDSNRTNRFKMSISVFDNSWDIYDQDLPSAEYFLKNGIKKIILRGDSIQRDLSKILYKFQKKGIMIFFTNGNDKAKKITLYPWSGLKIKDIEFSFLNK